MSGSPDLRMRLDQLGRMALQGLRIGAGVAWLVFLQVEWRLPPPEPGPKGSPSAALATAPGGWITPLTGRRPK